MRKLINCYANWRIDIIILLGIVALLLVSGESETFLVRIAGLALAVADYRVARCWYNAGKLKELDQIED